MMWVLLFALFTLPGVCVGGFGESFEEEVAPRGFVHVVYADESLRGNAEALTGRIERAITRISSIGTCRDTALHEEKLCSNVAELSATEVGYSASSFTNVDWGSYGIVSEETPPHPIIADTRKALLAGISVLIIRKRTHLDHSQCILPDSHEALFKHSVIRIDSDDDFVLEEILDIASKELHLELDFKFRLYNEALAKEMYWPRGEPCETIDAAELTEEKFRELFVLRSKPVIIRGGAGSVGCANWDLNHILSRVGDSAVHVKIAPNGVFEGPENLTLWSNPDETDIPVLPPHVLAKLESPDRVIVRPAATTIKIAELVEKLTSPQSTQSSNASFYLEYSSLAPLKELGRDVKVPPYAAFLTLDQKNVWLGAETRGKLHFDPFDNIMAVAKGKKTFTLMHPHRNEWAREGHIREATLGFADGVFSRASLPDATAMVMSPIHINDPTELEKYPDFAHLNATRLTCAVEAGDALYVPSHWWHEVASEGRYTLAANMWFHPMFKKKFPCATCRLAFNRGKYTPKI